MLCLFCRGFLKTRAWLDTCFIHAWDYSNPYLNWTASSYYHIGNMLFFIFWLEKNLKTSVLSEAISCFIDSQAVEYL